MRNCVEDVQFCRQSPLLHTDDRCTLPPCLLQCNHGRTALFPLRLHLAQIVSASRSGTQLAIGRGKTLTSQCALLWAHAGDAVTAYRSRVIASE